MALALALVPGAAVTALAAEADGSLTSDEDTVFYVQATDTATGETTVVKTYTEQELAEVTENYPTVSYAYSKGVYSTNSYVTMDTLLDGVDAWASGAYVQFECYDGSYTKFMYDYDTYATTTRYFYPNNVVTDVSASTLSTDETSATAVPDVIALGSESVGFTDGQPTLKDLISTENMDDTVCFLMGVSESGTYNPGRYTPAGLEGLTVVYDSDADSDDVWHIGTGSTQSLDVWSFPNKSKYFTYGYGLTGQDYTKFLTALSATDSTMLLAKICDDWGGSCYGMASWVELVALGTRSASDIDGSTDALSGYSNTDDALSAINYYQMQQYLEPAENAVYEFMAESIGEQLDDLATIVESGTPALIRFSAYTYDTSTSDLYYEEGNLDKYGHALVAYGLEDGDYTDYVNEQLGAQAVDGVEFTHRFVTYDCSAPDGGEAYYLYYSDDDVWCIPGWHALCQTGAATSTPSSWDNAYLVGGTSSSDVLNIVDYVSGKYTGTQSFGLFSSLYSRGYSYDASWASGSASVSGFTVTESTGDGDVNVAVDANVTADGDTSGSAATTAYLPVAGSYTVTPADDEVSLYLQGGDYLTSVEADAAGSATFYSDGGAAVSTTSATSISVSMTANSGASTLPWATVEVTAEDATELTTDLTEDGLVITGADAEKVVVTTHEEVGDEGEETTVEIDGAAVLVTADSEGAVEAEEGYDYTPATDEEREANRTADASDDDATTSATSIAGAKVTLAKTSYVYNGTARTPGVTVTLSGATLAKGTDYTVSYSGNENAGTAKVTVTGTGSYTGKVTATFKIAKAANTMRLKFKTGANVKYKKLKKKKIALKLITVTKAKGKVTCKRLAVKRNGKKLKGKQLKKIVVNKKTGKITLKKGLKKGIYGLKVKVKAAGTWNYQSATKTVTVKVKVK